MKFTAVLALFAAATVVSASTNAERLARGLPPNAPGKRASPVLRARHSTPSGTWPSSSCSSGPVQCCNDVQTSHQGNTCDRYMSDLGIFDDVKPGTKVGVHCTAVGAIAAGGSGKCTGQTVCCQNNSYQGLVNIGCTPIAAGAL